MRDQIARWRSTADLDARAGAPVGKALNAACDEVERLQAELVEEQRCADDRRPELLEERDAALHDLAEAEAERDDLRARLTGAAVHAQRLAKRIALGDKVADVFKDLLAALDAPAQATTEEKTDEH